MAIRLEHANMVVRNIDDTVRFLTAALPEFRIRHEGLSEGQRWMHIGTSLGGEFISVINL